MSQQKAAEADASLNIKERTESTTLSAKDRDDSIEERSGRQLEDEPTPKPIEWLRQYGLTIMGLLTILLLGCLVAHYSSITIHWSTTKDFTGALQDIVQILAFIAAGCWAYFKFIKGRTFQESLTPAVNGRFVSLDSVTYLVVSIQIKNVGSSKIDFDRDASALIFFEYVPTSGQEIHTVADKRLTSFDVLSQRTDTLSLKKLLKSNALSLYLVS
ncbi:MAG: hypothetical protein ABR555_12755 [Pyrinomonadaceae bacterium]